MTRGSLAKVIDALNAGRRFLVTAHPGPDGDALGSMVAATVMLERVLGRQAVAYSPDPVPDRFRFLEGTDRFLSEVPEGTFDTTLVLDCSDSKLFAGNDLPRGIQGTQVVIDHHKTGGDFGDVCYIDPAAASAGVLLYRVFSAMGLDLGLVAEPLYCSIMSDTGSFRYQNTNREAMEVCGALLANGVDPWRIASHLYEDRPRGEVELLGKVLTTLEMSEDERCASLTVTSEMLADCGCDPDATDGLINYARGISGVEVAVLFRPRDGGVRVSFRSSGDHDVSAVAARLGGGGHHNAAGCFLEDATVEQAREAVFDQVREVLRGASSAD